MPEHLQGFLTAESAKVENVELFSTGHLNGSGGWLAEPLYELWRSWEPRDPNVIIWLYKVAGGEYMDSCFGTARDEIQPSYCVYKAD